MSAAHHGSPEPVREGEEPAPQVPWQRVHPLTPLVRFWAFFVLLAFSFLRQGAEELVEHQDSGSWIGEVPAAVARADARTWALVGGGVLVVLVPMVLSWWFHRFRIVQDVLQVRQGALFRSEKQARLDRVQSIEITQHFLPRLLGLAELRFDVADAGRPCSPWPTCGVGARRGCGRTCSGAAPSCRTRMAVRFRHGPTAPRQPCPEPGQEERPPQRRGIRVLARTASGWGRHRSPTSRPPRCWCCP